jgi:hypothetical protein
MHSLYAYEVTEAPEVVTGHAGEWVFTRKIGVDPFCYGSDFPKFFGQLKTGLVTKDDLASAEPIQITEEASHAANKG